MRLTNSHARHIFLHRHGLGGQGPRSLRDIIDQIGFVQLDSINTLARAHDMILMSRLDTYQSQDLKALHEDHRALWEHWTHDASLIPMAAYPYWHHRFDRFRTRLQTSGLRWFGGDYRTEMDAILRHITDHGAVTTRDVGQTRSQAGWWNWSPSKAALEWLWRIGELAIAGRQGFQKSYDLRDRVIPAAVRDFRPSRDEIVHWAAFTALRNLGVATAKEIAAYYDAIDLTEAKAWLRKADVIPVTLEGADGTAKSAFALDITAPEPAPILRLLSPFDPVLRDRARAEFLFGFRYRIEVFVPEAKRQYGYYVFPILQGDRLIGRIDVKAFRQEGALRVKAFWPEVSVTPSLLRDLDGELHRLLAFSGCTRLEYLPNWQNP